MGLVANAVRVGVGLLLREIGVRLGGVTNDRSVALGIGSDLASPLVAVALVVGGLALALAADAIEDRLPHAVGVVQPPQANIHKLDAVLVAHLLPQIVAARPTQELVAEPAH